MKENKQLRLVGGLGQARRFKSVVFMFMVYFLLIPYSPAQTFKSPFRILKTGPGINFISDDPQGVQRRARLRFHIGLAPTFELTDKLYVKPEVAFSMKGGRLEYDEAFDGDFEGDILYRLNYFEFPLVLGFRPSKRLVLEAGGYGAINVSGSFDFDGVFFNGLGEFDRADIQDWDYGFVVGIGFNLKRTLIGVRYYGGLQEIASSPDSQPFLQDARLRTVQIYFQRKRR